MNNYLKIGNFICIPGKSFFLCNKPKKQWASFNASRSNAGRWDTVDKLLWNVYQYYFLKNNKYIEEMFTILETKENKEAVEKFYSITRRQLVEVFHSWERDILKIDSEIESQEKWNQFICKNYLHDFVVVNEDENYGSPISLKTGMAIDRELTQEYNPMPETFIECETFFKTANDRIIKRTGRICKMVDLRGEEYENKKNIIRFFLEAAASYDFNRFAYELLNNLTKPEAVTKDKDEIIDIINAYELKKELYRETGEAFFKGKLINYPENRNSENSKKVKFDPDNSDGSCKYTGTIYNTLWGLNKNKIISGFSDTIHWGGDTLNSVQTTLNQYGEHNENLFKEVLTRKESLRLYQQEKAKLFESTKIFSSFYGATHQIGNLCLVPKGFNGSRNSKTNDYWDASLVILKRDGFKEFNNGNFNKYINTFFLWDYVDIDFEILSLFSDTFKLNTACGSVEEWVNVPSKEEIPIFIENVVWVIRRRGIFMLAMIKIATANMPKEQYKHDEWNVTDIYKEIFYYYSNPESPFVGTDDVINKTLSELKDKESRFSAYKDLTVDQQDKVKIILEAAKEAIML